MRYCCCLLEIRRTVINRTLRRPRLSYMYRIYNYLDLAVNSFDDDAIVFVFYFSFTLLFQVVCCLLDDEINICEANKTKVNFYKTMAKLDYICLNKLFVFVFYVMRL